MLYLTASSRSTSSILSISFHPSAFGSRNITLQIPSDLQSRLHALDLSTAVDFTSHRPEAVNSPPFHMFVSTDNTLLMTCSSFNEAGPSRLPQALSALFRPKTCVRQAGSLPARRSAVLSSFSEAEDSDDDTSSRVGSSDCSIESESDPASLFGASKFTSAASHRSIPFSTRPMASEMVRPPEVS